MQEPSTTGTLHDEPKNHHQETSQDEAMLVDSSSSSSFFFPFRNLLPEIQDYVSDFLDPKTMLEAMLVDQQFYFRVVNSNLYKAFRVINLLQYSSTIREMNDFNELPSDDKLMRSVVHYLLGKFKFLKADCLNYYCRIHLKNLEDCPESLLKNIDKCLAIVIQNFKVYDTRSLKKAHLRQSHSEYHLFQKEYGIWNELIDLLELSVSQGEIIPQLYERIEESITFPRGPKEIDQYGPTDYPEFDNVKKKLYVDKTKDQWLSKFLSSIKNNSIYYLLARLSLIPFQNLPEDLKSNKDFVIFFLNHFREIFYHGSKMPTHKKLQNFEKITLHPSLIQDKDVIMEAFLTNDDRVYGPVFETSCYGVIENKVLDKRDYEFLGRVFKTIPDGLKFMAEYNIKSAQKYTYTENDFSEIIKLAPSTFGNIPIEWRHFEKHPELCKLAISLLGENFTSVICDNTVPLEVQANLFKLACQNLKNKEVYQPTLYKHLHTELREDTELMKQIVPIYPTICKNFRNTWLENEMELILEAAPYFPVLDQLFIYSCRKNFRSETTWEIKHDEINTVKNKQIERKKCTPDFLTTNLEFAKRTLKAFPYQLQRFSKEIQDNNEICNIIVESGCDMTVIPMFYNKVMKNIEWIKKSIEFGTNIFMFDEKVYNNPELFKIAVRNFPKILVMSEKFQKDREMVLYTIECCKYLRNESPKYLCFENIDQSIIDEEIVERAIMETPTFVDINNLPPRFKLNSKLAKATLLKYPNSYVHFPDHLKEDLEIAELAVRANANNLNELPKHLKQNRDFFLLAISRGYNYNKTGIMFPPLETDPIKWKYHDQKSMVIVLE